MAYRFAYFGATLKFSGVARRGRKLAISLATCELRIYARLELERELYLRLILFAPSQTGRWQTAQLELRHSFTLNGPYQQRQSPRYRPSLFLEGEESHPDELDRVRAVSRADPRSRWQMRGNWQLERGASQPWPTRELLFCHCAQHSATAKR